MTTGDRQLDQAIARFIHNPAVLPCDVAARLTDYWRAGGTDGRPEPALARADTKYRYKGTGPPDATFTRRQILEARK